MIYKNRAIILFVLISMLLMVIPANNVFASDIHYTVGFEASEGGASGQQFPVPPVTSILNSHLASPPSGTFYVHTSAKRSGANGFLVDGIGFWNLSYSSNKYLTTFKMYMNIEVTSGLNMNAYDTIYFMNKSMNHPLVFTTAVNRVANCVLGLRWGYYKSAPDYISNLSICDASGNWVSVFSVASSLYSGFDLFEFTINNLYGDATYRYDTTGNVSYLSATDYWLNNTVCNTTAIIDNLRIDSAYISSNVYFYNFYDDMNFTISDSYTGAGVSGCLDTTGLTQVGHFGYCAGDVQTSHVYKKYNVPVTTTISGVELQVSPDQFDDDPDLTHYECLINGFDLGNPICFNPESYYYVLQWDCNVNVTNDLATFDFYHSQKTINRYWAIGESCSSSDDLDADGDISYQYTDYAVSYEWKWILFIPFHLPVSTPYTYTRNRDLSMRWWCSGFPAQETYNYPDTLGLHNYYSHNTTGYVYDVTLGYDTITGSYTLGTPGLTYTLELYKNGSGTQSYEYGFPMTCRYPGSGFGFAPSTIGKYYIRLKSTIYRANVTAWVIGTFPPYTISTNPSITNQYENYNVNYRYHHPQGYVGGIAMDYYPSMLNKFTTCFYQRYPITNNQTTGFGYSSNSSQAEYWGLYTYANNLYSKQADAVHYIRIPSIFDNDIHPLLDNLKIFGNNEGNAQMVLQGTHIFPGSHVSVYVNGIFLGDVGDSQYFTISYKPTKIGTFNATLVLFQNNSQILLDYCSFTVSSADTEPGQGGGLGFDIHDFIPFPYDLFVCIGFIVFMVMLPTIIIVSLQKKIPSVQLHIPDLVMTFASIATGFCGFVLTVMWGLLSWVWFFAFLFTSIVILALMYYSGHKSGGGGNATQ